MDAEPTKADPPKRKRRWFQFSLRTLLIAVTVLAVVCGYAAWQAKIVHERKALLLEIVRKNGLFYPQTFTPAGTVLSHRSPIRWLLDDWYCEVIAVPGQHGKPRKRD